MCYLFDGQEDANPLTIGHPQRTHLSPPKAPRKESIRINLFPTKTGLLGSGTQQYDNMPNANLKRIALLQNFTGDRERGELGNLTTNSSTIEVTTV